MIRPLLQRARAGRVAAHTRLRPTAPSLLSRRSLATVIADIHREPTELDKITRLPNGLRVASEALPGSFAGVGVYIEAGSRYEAPHLRGVSHIMDRLAFKSTARSSAQDMLERVEALGGNIQCASSRESMMYQAATFNSAVSDAVELLAETIRHPQITAQEVSEQLQTAEYEINEIWAKPELILPELIHTAAFMGNTLGNPLLCPRESLHSIDRNTIQQYRNLLYRPDRMVVAFAGVAHDEAVRLATKHFGDMEVRESPAGAASAEPCGEGEMPTTPQTITTDPSFSLPPHSYTSTPGGPTSRASRLLSKVPFFKNLSTSVSRPAEALPTSPDALHKPAHYTGGFISLPPQPPPPNPDMPTFTHIHLVFEGLPISSPEIYALAALQTLLGGGGSFSAGGPGKGMYSRLYTNVLNQHGWVESCVAFNHSYTDSGLFGISASCNPQRIKHMIDEMCAQLSGLTSATGFSALNKAEVERAKNQLRSSLLMNLESRMVELEDLGRQVQVHRRKIPVREMCERIQALTADDLAMTAEKVLRGNVTNKGAGTGAPTVVLQKALTPAAGADITWDYIQDRTSARNLGRKM